MPYEERQSQSEFFQKWHFESWMDVIETAEVLLERIERTDERCEIVFTQLAYPSSGIEALEYLVEIFDGNITEVDVI